MRASQATIATDRAGRYLIQLCRHSDQMRGPAFARTARHDDGIAALPSPRSEWSDADGIIEFGSGRCILHATNDALTIRAEAGDEQQLARIQEGIARSLERMGRRDELRVAWEPVEVLGDLPTFS